MAERLQLSRRAGYRKPEGAVVVARPSKWGNPINLSDVSAQYPSVPEDGIHRMVVQDFRVLATRGSLHLPNWRHLGGERGPITWTYPSLGEIRAELAGHDLACWCPPELACHADVLLGLANGECGAHRGPEGPNEDLAQCPVCWMPTSSMRPESESFGWHKPDCSLPLRHEGFCQPGGLGHTRPDGVKIRG